MNIHLILQMASEVMGDREAVVCNGQRITFSELEIMARHVAAKAGCDKKLAYLGETCPAVPAALFGGAIAGTQFVPINYRLAPEQIGALLARVSPACLITEQGHASSGIEVISPGDAISGDKLEGDAPEIEGAVAIELFTSGTTGEPKSAILRHSHLMSYILSTVEFMSAGEEEATLISVPPYHIAGISAVLSSTYAGRRMVQLASFSPEAWLDLARQEQVTHAFLVPTMLQRLVEYTHDHPGALELPVLRAISYGGGKMPQPIIESALEMLPQVNFTNAYGLTETSSTICLLGPEEHRAAFQSEDPAIRRRLSSVGQALPSIELLVRHEDGELCGTEETGLVFVRGDQVSGEYKGLGSQLDEDGWFATRDIGYLDAEGYLFLDGRADDVIVRGGENISPGEIEAVLMTHPAVKDVAAVAVPDTQWGEAVGVAIVPTADTSLSEQELSDLVRKNLRSSRVPSMFKMMDELPYNETGKLLRRVIRDDFAE